jgi:hypothetical protein
LEACVSEVAEVIPVVGFATVKRFDLAQRLLDSIDYPVENLVVIDNSGLMEWNPEKPIWVEKMWIIRVPFGLGLVGAWNLIVKSTPHAPYWVLVNDDAWFEPGALKIIEAEVDTEALNFVQCEPKWSAPVFGEGMIEKVGLYDERFYPLYFDDNDLERRVNHHEVPIKHLSAVVHHNNSSTLNSGFQQANNRTYAANERLYRKKMMAEDYSQGGWSLKIRRENSWD